MRVKAGIALAVVLVSQLAAAATLEEVNAKGRNAAKQWKIDGVPRGIAVASDGTIYLGLTKPQSVVAIDPAAGKILAEVTLDREEIASTKDFSTMRIGSGRLYIAQGSDESVTILALPDLRVIREIGLEGETIRDALPDPQGRYVYLLGRKVRVWEAKGERELRTFSDVEPMAIATDLRGGVLLVVGAEKFPTGKATMLVFYDVSSLTEIGRVPLQTDRTILSAFFAAGDSAIVALAKDWLGEAPARLREEKRPGENAQGAMHMKIDFGDLVSSETICLTDAAGPQIGTTSSDGRVVVFAEKHCGAGGTFTASKRKTVSASIYGVGASAIARMPDGRFAASDPAGYLTIYRQPEAKE